MSSAWSLRFRCLLEDWPLWASCALSVWPIHLSHTDTDFYRPKDPGWSGFLFLKIRFVLFLRAVCVDIDLIIHTDWKYFVYYNFVLLTQCPNFIPGSVPTPLPAQKSFSRAVRPKISTSSHIPGSFYIADPPPKAHKGWRQIVDRLPSAEDSRLLPSPFGGVQWCLLNELTY